MVCQGMNKCSLDPLHRHEKYESETLSPGTQIITVLVAGCKQRILCASRPPTEKAFRLVMVNTDTKENAAR